MRDTRNGLTSEGYECEVMLASLDKKDSGIYVNVIPVLDANEYAFVAMITFEDVASLIINVRMYR